MWKSENIRWVLHVENAYYINMSKTCKKKKTITQESMPNKAPTSIAEEINPRAKKKISKSAKQAKKRLRHKEIRLI
jgi:hypothetical protein